MKTIIFLPMLCCMISLPVIAELTPEDLDKIRLIIKEEVDPIKKDVAVIQGQLQGINKRFDDFKDSVDKRFDHTNNLTYALIPLIVVAVGIPQIIIASRWRKDIQLEKQVQGLVTAVETLKQQRIVGS